jgi:RNA polymerase sigma-70 factor (ECF subfamily)
MQIPIVSDASAERLTIFERDRRHLLAVAFRLLGSEADAQDVVQDAWVRYSRSDLDEINNVSAWLTTVVTRLCLDQLRRKRALVFEATAELPAASMVTSERPEEIALLAAELTDAFAVVIQRLTPPQRVALILHEVFGTPFEHVAQILGTTPISAKKMASRARARLRASANAAEVDFDAAHKLVSEFLRATQKGDIDGLIAVLHPAATRTADPQALPAGAPLTLHGVQAVAAGTRVFRATARNARVVTINDRPAIAVGPAQHPRVVLLFVFAEQRILHYDVVADLTRLAALQIED